MLPVTPVDWQLLFPQTRPLAQWLSLSQSPCPAVHWFDDEQHDQSVDGIPSQLGAMVGPGVVVAAGANFKKYYNYLILIRESTILS